MTLDYCRHRIRTVPAAELRLAPLGRPPFPAPSSPRCSTHWRHADAHTQSNCIYNSVARETTTVKSYGLSPKESSNEAR